MISASKTTFSHYNLKILRPKVTINLTNLPKMSCEFRHRVYFNLHFSFRYFGILLLLWNVLSSPPRVKLNVKVRRNLVGKKMHKNKENSTTKKDSNSSDV